MAKDNLNQFFENLLKEHRSSDQCIDKNRIYNWVESLLCLLFPDFSNRHYDSLDSIRERYGEAKVELQSILLCNQPTQRIEIESFVEYFFTNLPQLKHKLDLDVDATFEGDPAAKSEKEVLFAYP